MRCRREGSRRSTHPLFREERAHFYFALASRAAGQVVQRGDDTSGNSFYNRPRQSTTRDVLRRRRAPGPLASISLPKGGGHTSGFGDNHDARITDVMENNMDPVSIIVSAVVAGASASLKGVASDAVKSAYGGLKTLIARKFGDKVDMTAVEQRPTHDGQQDVLATDLREAGAASDAEVLLKAREVLEGVKDLPPDIVRVIGVDLERIKSHLIEIGRITAEAGTGFRARASEIDTLKIDEIQTGKK
jgi:hypothetical protein